MFFVHTHAIIDYAVGALLIPAPFALSFDNGRAALWLPILLGASIIVHSLLSRHQLAVAQILPVRMNLARDAAGGLLLLVSPWLFGIADLIWWPHVLVGLATLDVVAMTGRKPA